MVKQWAGALIARNPQGRNPLEALKLPEYPEVLEHIRDLRQVIRDGCVPRAQRGFQNAITVN